MVVAATDAVVDVAETSDSAGTDITLADDDSETGADSVVELIPYTSTFKGLKAAEEAVTEAVSEVDVGIAESVIEVCTS